MRTVTLTAFEAAIVGSTPTAPANFETIMPLFEFRCASCDTYFQQILQSYRDIPDVVCPSCESTGNPIEKLMSTSSFVVKGYSAKTGYTRKG